jgi:hypothetical protein
MGENLSNDVEVFELVAMDKKITQKEVETYLTDSNL